MYWWSLFQQEWTSVKFHSVVCTELVYWVIVYKLVQHYACTYTGKQYLYTQAIFWHVLVAATPIIMEGNTDQKALLLGVYLVTHTLLYFTSPLLHGTVYVKPCHMGRCDIVFDTLWICNGELRLHCRLIISRWQFCSCKARQVSVRNIGAREDFYTYVIVLIFHPCKN